MSVEARSDLDALRRDMWERQRQARVAVRIYNRGSWIRFLLVFVPVPLVVVTFRLYLEAWHYYILGGAFIFFAGLLYVLDDRAADRREAALRAAKTARAAYQEARSAPLA
ncbi:MAG: hypothetical protein KA171_12820 [Reyranella sp.]|nr:hypothetical protein [Reyranella sp.]